jgi:hypothetical protein
LKKLRFHEKKQPLLQNCPLSAMILFGSFLYQGIETVLSQVWKIFECHRAAMGQKDEKMRKNKNPEKKIEHFSILHAKNPVFFPPYSEKNK